MTSTNDGSNLKSGQKDKRYYIESFQNLEARLNGPASTEQRTRNVCEAWRLVHGLCSHSTPDTRSHLLSWIQRNTAYAILQDEWGLPENKPQHDELVNAINDFILQCHETDVCHVWETTLLRRAIWYKGVLSNPWGHAVLKTLLDPKGTQPTDQEVIGWLREERAMMFVTRVRVMARAKRLIDLALVLVSAVMTRARRAALAQSDASDTAPGAPSGSKGPNFVEMLSREAGFTKDVWDLLIDIEFVLLHKQDQSTCIDLAKKIPLKDGKRIVERLRFRLDKSPADKKLWKKAKDVAILIAQVVITRCMVVTLCVGAVLDALKGCAGVLAQLLDGSRLPQSAAALAAPAASAAHLYAFADAIALQCKDKMDRQPFICELYVRAITAGMNELERLKLEKDKEPDVCALQRTLSGWFTQLGEVLSSSARLRCECLLTAFSLHPSANMYELVAALPPLATPDKSPKRDTTEVTSEFGSWATDSRTSSNFVKTSETLNLKQTQKQTNILSSSMFDTECGALGLKTELCEDLAVLLSGPRVKTLSWDMDRDTLLENCRMYMERTQEGTKALSTELKYLNLDPKSYDHLPEEQDDEDNYYGIEKGYELSLEYEDIWSDNNIDYTERSESVCSFSTVDSTKTWNKTKSRKNPIKYSDNETDPLTLDTEPSETIPENSNKTSKKHNEATKKKSKPKKGDDPDSKKLSESDQEKELIKKQKRKERRERKKREKMEMLLKQELQIDMDDNGSKAIGKNMLSAGIEPVKAKRKPKTVKRRQNICATDSDYDSQGKSSLASINSEGNDSTDVLYDGLFSMDDFESPNKTTSNNESVAHDTDRAQKLMKQNIDKPNLVKDKLKQLLHFRHNQMLINPQNRTEVFKYIENVHNASNANIHRPDGFKPQARGASQSINHCKTADSEKLNNLKHSENKITKNLSSASNNNAVALSPRQFQEFPKTQAATSGSFISDPHQRQFQEFLKLQNVPITKNASRQNQPATKKVAKSQLALKNPVLSSLIQQKPEIQHEVISAKDFNNVPNNSVKNTEVKLQQQNSTIVENKKHLKPQKSGVDNAPNTFSRLSYMHRNKQADMKYKQINEQDHMKSQVFKNVDGESIEKINNLQAKGEIHISKGLKRNSIIINRDNPPLLVKPEERIPNLLTTAAMQPKDLRLNIVNVSKFTKEIVENKVIITKGPKAAAPVDLQYLIRQANLDVSNNWKNQYPNTTIKTPTDVSPINMANSPNDNKVLVVGVGNKETTNDITTQHDNSTKVNVSQSGQYYSKNDVKATLQKEHGIKSSEDWKLVLNKLRSLKSAKQGVDALEMALNGNSSAKGNAEILRKLHKSAFNAKSIDSRDNKKTPELKDRLSRIDSKHNVKNGEAQTSNQSSIVKKIMKKAVTKCNISTKSLVNSKTFKTNNAIMPPMHNSDYDQLDDLIDDELRQEIEESSPLNSEVDIVYRSACANVKLSEKEKLLQNKSSHEIKSLPSSNVNCNVEQTSRQPREYISNPASRTCSVIKENTQDPAIKQKPKLQIISDQILPPYTTSSSFKTEKYSTKSSVNENRSSVIAGQSILRQNIPCVSSTVNKMSIITAPINIVHPANVILRNVSHVNQVQNLMLITSTNTVPESNHPTPVIQQPLPITSINVNNQLINVLKPQNTTLITTSQTAQVVNPINFGNITKIIAPNMPSVNTKSLKPIHDLCRNDMFKSEHGSQEFDNAMKITEATSQSNLNKHEMYVNHAKINSKIVSNRLREESIQSSSNNHTYCDEELSTNSTAGQALPIYANETRVNNMDQIVQPDLQKILVYAHETANKIMNSKSEFMNQNVSHIQKNVNNAESKSGVVASDPDKIIAPVSNVIQSNPDIMNEEKMGSPSILRECYDSVLDTEVTSDLGNEITTETMNYKNENERSPSILSYSCDLNIDMKLSTDIGNETSNVEKDQENIAICKQYYKENHSKIHVQKSIEEDTCGENEKQTKLEGVTCESNDIKILNKPMEFKLCTTVVNNKDPENEKNLVVKTSKTKSDDFDSSQNVNRTNESLSVYIPQRKLSESSYIDSISTKCCETKVISQVQQLTNVSEIIENKKIINSKHSPDYKVRSDKDIERLRNKRLGIIHREINHYIRSEPIALLYAPIQSDKGDNNDKITQPIQNNESGKVEQRLIRNNKSKVTTSIINTGVLSQNGECFIEKSNDIPTRRLRSSILFRTPISTMPSKSVLNLPNSEQQPTNTTKAEIIAPKRTSEDVSPTGNSAPKLRKNEFQDVSHNVNDAENVDNKQKDGAHSPMHQAVTRCSNITADTIDLTDNEPTKDLHSIKNISNCSLLNETTVPTTQTKIPLDPHNNVCKPKTPVQKLSAHKTSQDTNSKKQVTVTEIIELPSPNGDVTKKSLRIKLSNGNIFRATVSGNLKVDIKTVLSEPSIRSLLTTNVLQSKSCTVNVKHVTDSKNRQFISSVIQRRSEPAFNSEVIELSDDEDESIYHFKTEFGTYKTKSIDPKIYEKHQNKFLEKCIVKLQKCMNFRKIILNAPKRTLHSVILPHDISFNNKISDDCKNMNKMLDPSEIISDIEPNKINSEPHYSNTENISDTLKNLSPTLLESQIVQLHNDCRVNLERIVQQLKSNDCDINSNSVSEEPEKIENTLLPEENMPIVRSNSFSLLSDIEKIEKTLTSEYCLKEELQAKHSRVLPSFHQGCCKSEWILCTKSAIHSLEVMKQPYLKSEHDLQRNSDNLPSFHQGCCKSEWILCTKSAIHSLEVMKQPYLKLEHDFQRNSDNLGKSNCSSVLLDLLDTEENDECIVRSGSPSIIAGFESQSKHCSHLLSFQPEFCKSDWLLWTKATIHSLEANQQNCIKVVHDLHAKSDITLDSSTDCDSDSEFCDVGKNIEERNIMCHVPSLLSILHTFITSNMDILERYTIQKTINSQVFNSPTNNLKRKLDLSDKTNNCKVSKTNGQKLSYDLHAPVMVAVDKEGNNEFTNTIREQDHLTIVVETTAQCLQEDMPKFEHDTGNVSKFDEIVDNVLPVSKILNHVDSNTNTINHMCEENESNLKLQISQENNLPIETSREFENCITKSNCNKNKLEFTNKGPMEHPETTSLKQVNVELINKNVDNAVCGIDSWKNVKNHEFKCKENQNGTELGEYEEENVTVAKTSTELQILTNDNNKSPLNCNDQKSIDDMENMREESSNLYKIEEIRKPEPTTIAKTTIQLNDFMPNVTTDETCLEEIVDHVASVSKVLCDEEFNKCEEENLVADNLISSEHTNSYKDIEVSINNDIDNQIQSQDVILEMHTDKDNEELKLNTFAIANIQAKTNSIEDIGISQEVVSEFKVLVDSEKLKQHENFDENINHENRTDEKQVIICEDIIQCAAKSPLKFISDKSYLNDKSTDANIGNTTKSDETKPCDVETISNDKKYINPEQIVLEDSFIMTNVDIPSDISVKSSECNNISTSIATNCAVTESFGNNMTAKSNDIEKCTYIPNEIDLCKVSEEIDDSSDIGQGENEQLLFKSLTEKGDLKVINTHKSLNSTEATMSPTFFAKPAINNSENELLKIQTERNKNTLVITESHKIIEEIAENNSIKAENSKKLKNEHESVTLIYKGDSNVVLKGSPYVDPVVGTCYIFPLSSSSCNQKDLSSLNTDRTINIIKSLKKKTLNEGDNDMDQTNFSLILPKITYSRFDTNHPKSILPLKRKSNSKNACKLQKKYRKGKNIDTCKQTAEIYGKIGYTKQYERLIEYCTSIKFSFSRPFHKNSIDPANLLRNWPIRDSNYDNYTNASFEECDKLIFMDIDKENVEYTDPLQQTLAEEIAMEYDSKNECTQATQIEDSNFNMGFGERSDRVIQNLANGMYTSKVSAATLSDVKLPQPSYATTDNIRNIPQIIKQTNDEELAIMKRCISFIQQRDKVKDFFRKSASELLHLNLTKGSNKNILYELTSPQFIDPPMQETVVNVVQVGQLPVSASAQNPVTCDPRVTHVSNASPPQCSVENSPDGDQNASKTEYTELTTADLSLPLVQEYQQSSQVIMSSQSQLNVSSKVTMDINCESKLEHKEEIETNNENTEETNNFVQERKNVSSISYSYNAENDSFKSGNNSYKTNNDSYKSDSTHKGEKRLYKLENNASQSESSRNLDVDSQNAIFDSLLKEDNNDYVSTAKTTNGTSEKTDQIAHAMNAAGITTGTDSISNSNNKAQAVVNILTQKIRQNTVNTSQSSVNNYTKGSPINAMALQQALAQILPPPLNQTNSSDHHSAPITPQVLHIVQGKNASGNQITIVDNQPTSVINNSNNTPVLHIVQNKSAIGSSASNSNSNMQNNNSFSGLSLVDAGIQQSGNQLLHIVNTGGQKNSASGQLLKRVNLLTNLTNVQGSNEQKMVQFVCKSADGKSIQLNAPHQRSMVLRLQPIESTNVPSAAKSEGQEIQSPNFVSSKENNNTQQQEIKSRSVYEENYAKFIQNSSPKPSMPEKSTSLPKFNQAFGKQVYQDNNQKSNDMQSNTTHVANTNSSSSENVECSSNDNAINLEHINQMNSPPLLLRKSPAQTSQPQQGQSNLVQQIKQTIAPVNIQTMHGGVIYTRQIPVNIGGGQTINLITVPSTDLIDESGQKQQGEVKFVNQNEMEPSIIKIVPQSQNSSASEGASEDSNALNTTSDTPHTSTATHTQPVLTQMRIKLPMLSKAPQMVSGARLVRPSFFQIQRNVIGGANQPVYQQLVLTAAPSLGQQTVRPPQAQSIRVKTTSESQTSSESQMSSSTLEQLREFDMVLEQVKERSTVQPNSNTNNIYTKLQSPTESTDTNTPTSVITTEPTQQVLYSIGNNNSLNVAYVNRKAAPPTPTTSTFARSPDSSGVADSPTSSTHVQIPAHSSSNETSSDASPQQSQPKPKTSSKSKSRPKTSSNPTTSMKINNTVPPKTSTQKPLEDEQTTQRILYILAEYKEQVENSPDKDKPAPRRRSNPPSNPGSSKRKKSSSGSRRSGGRDMSPIHGEDTCRTMGSEDSSCGTSQGDCTENCLETHSPQDSPRKVVRKLTFENETPNATPRQQPPRNVIVADGQTITVARGTAGKPATAVLMPANYILPVSMVKGGQQIAIVTNRGPKILTVGGEGGGNALLLQRLIGPAGLKPMLARPGVRHVRLPTAALQNLQAFNIATATNVQPPDSTESPAPAPTPPDLVETRATSSPWPDRDSQDVKPERSSSPEGSEPWNLPSSADPHDYSYEETVRAENLDRTVLDAIPDRYSPDLEAQRIFDKMFDVDTKKSYIDSQDNSPRCGYDIDASDCDDKGYHQVVQKRDQRQHRLAHVSAAALRHKYAMLEHELRLQKSLSEECSDLGVDSPSAAELFPEAELLFASSPAHDPSHRGHTPQPGISQTTIPQPDIDDQIATDQLLNRNLQDEQPLDVTLGLDEGIVTVSEDGMQATITLDQEEFARSHPNTTFHSEPTEEENVQPYTISGIKGRHITSTIFHAGRAPATVLMTAPQTTVISQALPDQQNNIKYIDNIINPQHNICLSSVLVKDDGLTKYDSILNDSRELHLSNTASAIVHSNATQVIRRVCYDDDKRDSRFLLDETDALIAGDDAKMIAEDSSRDATLESIADDRSSPERHTELFWESNSASERSDSRRPLDFSSDSDKCCKSPLYDETNSTDSSGVGTHMRLDSVIKDARGLDRSGSADNSSADDTLPPLRTYPPKRMYHGDGEMERSVSGKTRAGERSPDGHEVRRRASVRGVVKRGCHCCNGSPAPPRPKKSRQKKPSIDFNN